jgi:sulfonate transport system substrate-binding protein
MDDSKDFWVFDPTHQSSPRSLIARRTALRLALGLGGMMAAIACSPTTPSTTPASPTAASRTVRIGHQKFDPFTLVKARGGLEKRLEPLGTIIEWTEFQAGPPLLEALNVGSIDIARTGDAPPVIAQAADAPLVYIGGSAPKNKSSALLVQENSPIQSIADLRGKKVAFAKGSSANYLVVKVLETGGLTLKDVEPVFLSPAEARSAFEQGSIDGWVIWDPFYAAAQTQIKARVLRDSDGLAANRDFYLASRAFVDPNRDIIEAIATETQAVATWADANPDEVVEILSPILGIDAAILNVVTRRRNYGYESISDDMVAEQQQIADTFYALKLIPKEIAVADVIWKPR